MSITVLRPTAQVFVPQATRSKIIDGYHYLVDICCSALEPDRKDRGVAVFQQECEKWIKMFPTIDALRAHIAAKPLVRHEDGYLPDHGPHLDLALRLMSGWETDGVPDYLAALNVLYAVTTPGKWTEQTTPCQPIRSPSRDACGRANALSAYAYHQLSLRTYAEHEKFPLPEIPRSGYCGPEQYEWRLHLCAVAHAADAARQMMVTPAVLAVGYHFRKHMNIIRWIVKICDYPFVPLMRALREHRESVYAEQHEVPLPMLRWQGQEERIRDQLRDWIWAMDLELKEHPDPYRESNLPPTMHYRKFKGELNE